MSQEVGSEIVEKFEGWIVEREIDKEWGRYFVKFNSKWGLNKSAIARELQFDPQSFKPKKGNKALIARYDELLKDLLESNPALFDGEVLETSHEGGGKKVVQVVKDDSLKYTVLSNKCQKLEQQVATLEVRLAAAQETLVKYKLMDEYLTSTGWLVGAEHD